MNMLYSLTIKGNNGKLGITEANMYTINEYAKIMKVHRKTVENWIKADLLELVYTPTGMKRIIGEKEKKQNDN